MLILVGGTVEEGEGGTFIFIVSHVGLTKAKQNKKNSKFKTQVTKEKSMWVGKNIIDKKFKTKDIAFKEESIPVKSFKNFSLATKKVT